VTVRDHVHYPLDEEVTAIGGSYRLVKEARVDHDGRELLYIVGHGVFDTTCCGAGGCSYALVPGFVIDWRGTTDGEGRAVSKVEPIEGDALRRSISRLVRSRETVQEVRFD
jgi:hypothetical protein